MVPQTVEEAMALVPHLISPAHLAIADTNGKWIPAPHLRIINRELVTAWLTPNSRLAINIPFQHGKSWLGSVYFPAWVLLRWPATRIALASYEESFAARFGAQVKDVLEKYGPGLGLSLRDDTQAKGEWAIAEHNGGMVCKGRGGALVGRPADLLILDDLIKNPEEALSPTILDNIWDWYSTVAYSRLSKTAPVVGIGTRWVPKDIFGRWKEAARQGGDEFRFVNLRAIADGGPDPLNRKEGEALWPEGQPLARLEKIRQTNARWFKACWQGEPAETQGLHYQPRTWPKYLDVGDAWRIQTGVQWHNYRKLDCTILIAVDWAQSGKKKSDRTAIVVSALTPDGKLLILDVFDKQLRYEENAPALEEKCIHYSTLNGEKLYQIVASDDDMLSDALVVECRRFRIPEIKPLDIRSRSKIIRAQSAIIRSQNGLFYMPEVQKQWFERCADQLSSFSGEEGAEDDIADCFGILGRLADDFDPRGMDNDEYEPVLGGGGAYQGIDGGW